MPTLEDAIALAVEAHWGQVDDAGRPYILHPLAVMLRGDTDDERVVGVLHDVVEDTGRTPDDLRRLGYSAAVVTALDCLTRRRGEPYPAFVERAAADPIARKVKVADLEDNMDVRRMREAMPAETVRLQKYLAAWRRLKGLP